MTTNGFVHIDREKFLNSPIWNKPNHYFKIFMYLFLTANFADDDYLKRGQAVADLKFLSNLCSSGRGGSSQHITPENIYFALRAMSSENSQLNLKSESAKDNKMLVTLSDYDILTNSKLSRTASDKREESAEKISTIIYNNNKNNKQVTSRAESSVKVKPTAFSNFKPRDRDFDKIKQKSKEKLRRKTDEQQN